MPATYTKPTKIPRWADTSTNILEPPELKKDEGWLFEEIPPSSFENWRTNLIGSWAKWLDERLFDGSSADEFLIKSPGAGTEAIRIADTFVKVSRDLRVEGDDLGIEVDGTTSRRVYFDAAKQNWLGYSIGGSRMELYAGGVLAIYADATGTYINGDLNIGDDLSLPGGLAVGIATPTIVDDVIQLGDADLRWEFNSGNPRFIFDHSGGNIDAETFDRTNSRFGWMIANVEEMRLSDAGLAIANGLFVGDIAGVPLDDAICIGDQNFKLSLFSTNTALNFDSGDGFQYARTSNELSVLFGSAEKFRYTATGLTTTGGIHAGALTGIGGNGRITSTDLIQAGTSVRAGTDLWAYSGILYLSNDAGDSIQWDGTKFRFILNTAERASIDYSAINAAYALCIGTVSAYAGLENGVNFAANGYSVRLLGTVLEFRLAANTYGSVSTAGLNSAYDLTLSGASSKVILSGQSGAHVATKGHFWRQYYSGVWMMGNGSVEEAYRSLLSTGNLSTASVGTISTLTIPGGSLRSGSILRVKAHFRSTSSAMATATITIGTGTATVSIPAGGGYATLEFEVYCANNPTIPASFFGTYQWVSTSYGASIGAMTFTADTVNNLAINANATTLADGTMYLYAFTVERT